MKVEAAAAGVFVFQKACTSESVLALATLPLGLFFLEELWEELDLLILRLGR